MRYKGIGQKKFETACGLSNGYMNSLRYSPSAAKLQSILGTFPELNRDWVLTGHGDMLNSTVASIETAETQETSENTHGVRFVQTSSGMRIDVPVVPYAALGSPADEYGELLQLQGYERASFPVDGIHHGKYFAFRVEGDSMDDGTRDGFQAGDVVLVRELDRDDWAPRLHFARWPFWVICWGNCVRLKQIVAQDEAGSTITCHSLNPSPEYTDFTLQLNDVNRLFNVIQVRPKPRMFSL